MPRYFSPLCLVMMLGCSAALAEEPASPPQPPASQEDADVAAEPAVERPLLPERSEQDATALQQRFDNNEQQQLEAPKEQFLALWLPANVGEPKGMVIILPGDNLHAAAPQMVEPLRRQLPDVGWHSLSLSLPDPLSDLPLPRPLPVADAATEPQAQTQAEEQGSDAPAAPSSTDASAETETETETSASADAAPSTDAADEAAAGEVAAAETQRLREEAMAAHAERVFARIDAAVVFASQREAPRVILVGQGSGAYWAARFLKEKPAPGVSGLLMVSPRLPAGHAPPLEELAPALAMPVGDLYYKDQAAERQAALRRLQASKRLKAENYRQVPLKALPGNSEAEQEQLYRRARGWLELEKK